MELTAQQKALLDRLKDFIGVTVKETVAAAMKAAQPSPVPEALRDPTKAAPAIVTEKGLMFGRLLRAIAASKGDPERAANHAKKAWGDDAAASIVKALQASDAVAGGFLITDTISAEIIELLRPMSIVRALGAVVRPMTTGTLRTNKLSGGATAGYIGEGQDITITQQTFAQLVLTWKKLATLVPISNDWLRFSDAGTDGIIRDDAVAAMAQAEDVNFIRSQGTQNAPKGLRYWAPAANVIAANATVNLANVTIDLGKLILALVNANVKLRKPGWMFAPRIWNYLMTVRDANGNFAFREEMLLGRLWGYPFAFTTQIPINLGGGGNESEVYFADFADVLIGEATQLVVDASTEAAYIENNALVSAFSRDQTLIRVIAQHDIGMRHDESIAVLKTVLWV